ncbi:MAG: DegV family protein [Mycobacterium leprae]
MLKIVTDSTASIPPAICRALNIDVVPMTIRLGNETFVDGVDPTEQFYDKLAMSDTVPTTSTPSPGAFLDVYRRLAGEASTIISLHVMETKSAVVSVARMAAAMLPDVKIHVVDSQSVSLGLGLLAIAAARAAQMGATAEKVLEMLERMIPKVEILASMRTLRELRKSGRVSLGQAMMAGVLSIKPILNISHDVIEVVDKARGWPKAVEQMVDSARAKVGEARVMLAVVHTNAEADARELMERIKGQFNCVEAMVAEAGPTLASHAGPGCLGIVTIQVD